MARFDDLPKDASLTAIYGRAGEIFEEQVRRDAQTDYTRRDHFNVAIWFIAEEAQRQDFIKLQDMSIRRIANEIGNYIASYWRFRQ